MSGRLLRYVPEADLLSNQSVTEPETSISTEKYDPRTLMTVSEFLVKAWKTRQGDRTWLDRMTVGLGEGDKRPKNNIDLSPPDSRQLS